MKQSKVCEAELPRFEGLNDLPTPLVRALQQFNQELQPFRRVHKLIDAVEVLVKFHTVIVVSDYFSRQNVSEQMKALLAAGLRTPSLGIWWQFAREIAAALAKEHTPFVPGIDKYLGKKGALFKALEGENNLIRFRNGYAHGATPSDMQCEADLKRYFPVVRDVLQKADHLHSLRLFFVKGDGSTWHAAGPDPLPREPIAAALPGKCCLANATGQALILNPLLICRDESNKFFFFNDLREKDAAILNYDTCDHMRDAAIRSELLDRYPLDEWTAKPLPEEFRDRIEQLTETFKGRREELRRILRFVARSPRGLMMVWGGPGVGKSALLARAIQVMKWPAEIREAEDLTTPSPLGEVRVFEYFIRRGQRTANTDYLLDNLNSRLEAAFRTGLPLGGSTSERAKFFDDRLKQISTRLKETQRLVILIDGLDEGMEAAGLLESLPKETPDRVVVIYASREHPRIRQSLYELLDRENHDALPLSGLTASDVRALLNDYVNKYEIGAQYLEAVASKSQGNPLYLKLLCRGLERGDYRLNDELQLPSEMKELYRTVMKRLSGTAGACDFLRVLAVAQDYFTPAMAQEVLKPEVPALGTDLMESTVLPECMELLTENPLTEKVRDFQLFHESLREFIQDEFPAECRRWERRIADWCRCWNDLAPSDESGIYAVRYAIHHMDQCRQDLLKRQKDSEAVTLQEEMIALLWNSRFRQQVFERCGNASSLQHDIPIVQRLLLQKDRNGSEMDAFLQLAHMYHYEPGRRYRQQLESLSRRGAAGQLEGVERLAMMGGTPRDKVLLVMRAVCQAGNRGRIPQSVSVAVRCWLDQANESALSQLWGALAGAPA